MKKLTRTELNFENLIESAFIIERSRHRSSCENNEEELSLAELIDRELYGRPDTADRYEYKGEDPYDDYDEENNEDEGEYEALSAGIRTIGEIPPNTKDPDLAKRRKELVGGLDGVVNGMRKTAGSLK